MMEHRGIRIFVVVFWLASMGWLTATKIVPTLAANDRPDQRVFRPESKEDIESQAWKIQWNNRPIGWARATTRRFPDGQGHVESVVRLENLTARQMLKEMFGAAAIMIRALDVGGVDEDLRIGCRMSTEMNFDAYGRLKHFHSGFDLDSVGQLIRTRGVMREGALKVDVFSGEVLEGVALPKLGSLRALPGTDGSADDAGEEEGILLSRLFEIPEDALIADSLLPQSRLTGLALGQRWTFQAYRAYPPQNPLREIEARVERQEMLGWGDDVEPVFVVSYRDLGGSGLTTASDPNSWLWVRRDGTVLKQQMRLGNVTVEFMRCALDDLPDGELDEAKRGRADQEANLTL